MIKRTNRMALAAMRTTGLVWSSDVGSVHLFDTVKLSPVQANDFHFHAIDKMQHRWNMLLVAIGIEPSGSKYIKQELHALTEPRFHTATVDYFNQEHERLLATINPKHEKQAGWIATPFERDFTDAEVMRILRV